MHSFAKDLFSRLVVEHTKTHTVDACSATATDMMPDVELRQLATYAIRAEREFDAVYMAQQKREAALRHTPTESE